MSQTTPNVVLFKGDPPYKEANANAAITPGHFVLRSSAGTVGPTSANHEGSLLVADFQDYMGKDINTAYASGDRVSMMAVQPGDEINALVPAAAAAIVIGDLLQTGAGGTLIKRTSTNRVVAIALAAVDNSAGGSAVRLKVEIV